MALHRFHRRAFLKSVAAGAGAYAGFGALPAGWADAPDLTPDYSGPNVVLIRFGGGVRREETIADPNHTYCPYFTHELTKRGTLYTNMVIDQLEGVETSHGQGTLYILTGKYDRFKDVGDKFLGARFESKVPTIFEYLRKQYNVPAHETLIVNGEDRTDEEFYSFSNHHLFGANFRSNVLSLYRYKVFLLRAQIAEGKYSGKALEEAEKELAKLESLDYRLGGDDAQSPEIQAFWERWRGYYGETGLVNPRGDALLTELSCRALKELRPRLLIVNFNDPDYVHWGNPSHYTRGISIIDRGIKRIVETVEADDFYRDNTVFAIVPDCGRDNNRMMEVPFQHHFNSKASHEIFALFMGPGIARGVVVDKTVQQVSVAPTIGQYMHLTTSHTEGELLEETFA